MTRLLTEQPRDRVLTSGRGKAFLSTPRNPDSLYIPPSLLSKGIRGSSQEYRDRNLKPTICLNLVPRLRTGRVYNSSFPRVFVARWLINSTKLFNLYPIWKYQLYIWILKCYTLRMYRYDWPFIPLKKLDLYTCSQFPYVSATKWPSLGGQQYKKDTKISFVKVIFRLINILSMVLL